MEILKVNNLSKVYGKGDTQIKALDNVSFSVEKGEFVSIVGPSGSGKSTLLHILSFLDRPTGGSYRFLGKSMEEMNDLQLAHVRNKDMGFVFQAFNLLSRLSVYDNVVIPLLYSNATPNERKKAVEDAVRS